MASAHVQADFVHDPDSELPECPPVEGKTCRYVHNKCLCKGEIKTEKPEKEHTSKEHKKELKKKAIKKKIVSVDNYRATGKLKVTI